MKDKDKTKEQLREELQKAREELETQTWGLTKTNESIKLLYKELEEKNKRLQELDRLKSDFISTVSHELRTPLAITKEGISLVLDEIPGKINEEQKDVLANAKDSIDRLARIINSLLDISKIEAGRIELKKGLINLNSLVRQLSSSFGFKIRDKDLELRVNLPKAQIEIYADADKIAEVFTNLIYNAIKFTKEGFIEISAIEKENETECSVSDTGLGISKENLPKIFDKFQQFGRVTGPGGEKGTGLGLSIAKGIVELHKGRIWIESQLGKGTRFIFTLPKYTAEAILREYVDDGIKEAIDRDTKLSLIIISLDKMDKSKRKFTNGEAQSILKDMERALESGLQQEGSLSLQAFGSIIVPLSNYNKESAVRKKDALEQLLKDRLSRQDLSEKVRLQFTHLTYPDEVKNTEEIIEKVKKS